ncbi:MAG: very short patch repair endonuclease [Ignavibacteriae bacterium]|nr:very short patch repair endonuclease [Ignavibacteriota bacterium]
MDNLTPDQRKKNMSNIKSKDTLPERLVEAYLNRKKIYVSRKYNNIVGKPDFIFRRKKVLLFVDSDFWHGHLKRCVMPKSNQEYWNKKILRNRERDKIVNKQLRKEGWTVIRVWEYDIKKNVEQSLRKVIKAIDK